MITNYYKAFFKVQSLFTLLAVISLAVASAQTVSIAGQTTIDTNGARPLAEALQKLQALTKVPINYEEAVSQNAASLIQTTPISHPGLNPRKGPRGGRLTAAVSLSGVDRTADAYSAAHTLMSAYYNASLPGRYTVAVRNSAVDVVPSQTLDSSGSLQEVKAVMSQKVSFPTADRTTAATLQLIIDSAAQAAGVKVKLLSIPFTGEERVSFGASGQAAREAIASLLVKVGSAGASTYLLFDPQETSYYFSVVPVIPASLPVSGRPAFSGAAASVNPFFIKQ